MIKIECPNVSKVYNLGDGRLIGVDQTNSNEDKTCLCFAKLNKAGEMFIKKIEYTEKQEDMDKYINENLTRILGVFGVSEEDTY